MNLKSIFDFNEVVCRPALKMDTDQVMELCSHIWDGGDYIPIVWDEWLADPEGLLGVAELNGRVVGVFKLTRFQENEWYLEGLRVHPEVQGKGIAAHIHNYVVETWRKMGGGRVRLVTHSENVKVQHMCEQGGFKRIAEFIPYRADSLQGGTSGFTRVGTGEAQIALDFISHSQTQELSASLVNLEWVYAELQLKYIHQAITDELAWWWHGGLGFLSYWVEEEEEDRQPGIQLIGCRINDLADLLVDYRRLMGTLGYSSAGWVAPNHPVVIDCLNQAGFNRSWDKSLYVYELRSPLSHRAYQKPLQIA
jgi:ribosomal protein S18 acetylase RimI-like enzyme